MDSLNTVKVALEVDDFYLRVGLKIILADFFYRQKQEVFFVSDDVVDLVVRAEYKAYSNEYDREILISSRKLRKKSDSLICNCTNIIFKNDRPETFKFMLEKTMDKEFSRKTCFSCRRCLTRREKEILARYSDGLSTGEIANASGLHVKSVSQHKRNAMRKLGVRNMKELLEWLAVEKIC
ncbi:helix-turn-helix transcriptional regulator [Enterobacter cloacae]|uniref:response regulator transcription factor n=1 Tax=Enterobacter cloacae TaxID=550 RepID=UPI000E4F4A6D|nr:helix-turn-helix transcriptional regulator [Enterobacter cloacae]ELE9704850.1 helix-turn-helix transcriptional regulator [Enterobacter cloacae]RHH99455.1 LuxR family transcriptional regulator [Enterobacter cloacae]